MSILAITHIPIVVPDQDEALAWYVNKLDFVVREDSTDQNEGYRWLTIGPSGSSGTSFILMTPQETSDDKRIGNNGMCVLASDDVAGDCKAFAEKGVKILDGPNKVGWGLTAIITDRYGNPYYLVQAPSQ
jgi:catechol 2,3-dioxygenase-like lactoylglutathione lyase family enzyme